MRTCKFDSLGFQADPHCYTILPTFKIQAKHNFAHRASDVKTLNMMLHI